MLSGDGDVACASCHHPDNGYAERIDLSRGVGAVGLSEGRTGGALVKRNSMSILNVALNGIADADDELDAARAPMFWDNRIRSLERQALRPAHSFEEMRGDAYPEDRTIERVTQKLEGIVEYVTRFEAAYPGERIGERTISNAIAAFERTLIAVDSPFDRYLAGDLQALNGEEESGLRAFLRADCQGCHSGPLLADFELHRNGVPDNRRLTTSDLGDGTYRFRTPTLRNLSTTPPYMHSGVFESLEDVVEFYHEATERGGAPGSTVARDELDEGLERVSVPRNAADEIAAFLRALSDDDFDRTIPERVPSGLPPGGAIGRQR